MLPDLAIAAARHALAQLSADDMCHAVDQAMDAGFYDDTCLAALDSRPARMDEVLPAFLALLAARGVDVPDRRTALRRVCQHHFARIASGAVDPWRGLCAWHDEVYALEELHMDDRVYVGDGLGLQHLISLYSGIDDLRNVQGTQSTGPQREDFLLLPEHRQAIVEQAAAWLRTNDALPVG